MQGSAVFDRDRTAVQVHGETIRAMACGGFAGAEQERKGAVIGALRLYLDFINLFLLLLRLFGEQNN